MKQWLFWSCLFVVVLLVVGCPSTTSNVKKVALEWDVPVSSEDNYNIDENHFLELNYLNNKFTHHLGEDWNGAGGGNTDRGDPVLAPAYGKVYSIRDVQEKDPWGKVIQIEHPMPNGSKTYSTMAHLGTILVSQDEEVYKGDQIGTIGDANGYYNPVDNNSYAHLHFEIRKTPWVQGNELGRGYLEHIYPSQVQHLRSPSLFIKLRQKIDPIRLSRGNTYFTTEVMTGNSLVSFEYNGRFAGWYQAVEDGWVEFPQISNSGWQAVPFIFHPDYDYRIKAKKSGITMYLGQPDWDHPAVKRDTALADFIALGLFPESYITEVFPDTLDLHDQPAGTEPGEWQSIEVATDYGQFKLYRGYDPNVPLGRVLFFEPNSGLGLTANFWGTTNY